ncbi:MAG: DNA-binding protein [Deltaproteobacteria bacterium]|nr:DNA-binding protein [Deltaproteobacteria bacterium]
MKRVKPAGLFIGKLKYEGDLLGEITEFCIKENIRLGRIEALGSVQKARLGFYNQETREYHFFNFNRPFEITTLVGSVSMKDGSPMVHAHITLADGKGNCFGGHLAAGTIIYACELTIEAFDGPELERGHDEDTGLPLWEMEE